MHAHLPYYQNSFVNGLACVNTNRSNAFEHKTRHPEFRQMTRRHGGWGSSSSREYFVKVVLVDPEDLCSATFCIAVEVGVEGVAPAK